jgi:hypothetical protein
MKYFFNIWSSGIFQKQKVEINLFILFFNLLLLNASWTSILIIQLCRRITYLL